MTKQEKQKVITLRSEGYSYLKISELLHLSENTVKSFCRRNNLGGVAKKQNQLFCKQCGKPLEIKEKSKPRKFCSDNCRRLWWNSNLELVNRKAFYTCQCLYCGREFESYGNSNRKYCSRACYGKSKMKVGIK